MQPLGGGGYARMKSPFLTLFFAIKNIISVGILIPKQMGWVIHYAPFGTLCISNELKINFISSFL